MSISKKMIEKAIDRASSNQLNEIINERVKIKSMSLLAMRVMSKRIYKSGQVDQAKVEKLLGPQLKELENDRRKQEELRQKEIDKANQEKANDASQQRAGAQGSGAKGGSRINTGNQASGASQGGNTSGGNTGTGKEG